MYKNIGLFLCTLATSIFIGVCALSAVAIQHHWGYFAAMEILKLPQKDSWDYFFQGIFSVIMQTYIITPIAIGLSFGYLKQQFKGSTWWRWALLPLLLMLFYLVFKDGGDSIGFDELTLAGILLLTVAISLYLPMILAEAIFIRLRKINKPWKILAPGLLALPLFPILNAVFSLGKDSNTLLEASLDGFVFFFAAMIAAMCCKSRTFGTACVAALLTILPILFFNSINLCFNLLHIDKNSLQDQSFVSCALICSLDMSAVLLGALAGLALYRFKSKDQLTA